MAATPREVKVRLHIDTSQVAAAIRAGREIAKPDAQRRLRIGRLAIYIEPRDVWVGVFVARNAIYVCPIPLLVFRWARA